MKRTIATLQSEIEKNKQETADYLESLMGVMGSGWMRTLRLGFDLSEKQAEKVISEFFASLLFKSARAKVLEGAQLNEEKLVNTREIGERTLALIQQTASQFNKYLVK